MRRSTRDVPPAGFDRRTGFGILSIAWREWRARQEGVAGGTRGGFPHQEEQHGVRVRAEPHAL